MQRVGHPPWLALAVVALAVTACKRSAGERDSPALTRPESATEPTAAATASFAEVARKYAAAKARGPLSKEDCAKLSAAFLRVFDSHRSSMAIAKFDAGAVREECGDKAGAEAIYRQLVREAPSFALAHNNLGVLHWNRGEEREAVEAFKRAVQAEPTATAPRNNLAAALRERYAASPEQQEFVAAEDELQSVLALDAGNGLAFENLARLYYDRGRLDDKSYLLLADLVVTQALAKAKDGGLAESAEIHNLRGLLFMQRDNQIDALKAFKRAVEIDSKHAGAHMNIALVAIRFRDYATAEKSLQIALADQRRRKNAEAYLGLGVAQRGLRQYEAAEKSFKKALQISKTAARARYNLGILYHDHIAPQTRQDTNEKKFDKRPYETAKHWFGEFVTKSSGNTALASHAADAQHRMRNIDKLVTDIAKMDASARESARIAEEERAAAEREKERLRKLEDTLRSGS